MIATIVEVKDNHGESKKVLNIHNEDFTYSIFFDNEGLELKNVKEFTFISGTPILKF